MTHTTADVLEDATLLVLQHELATITEELANAEQMVGVLEAQHAAAVEEEGRLMDEAMRLQAIATPLLNSTRSEGQAGVLIVGDTHFRANFGEAARAWDAVQVAEQRVQAASAATHTLRRQRTDLESAELPRLRGLLVDKEAEIARHQQAHAAAVAKAQDPTWLDDFRRRVRGDKA